MAGGVGQNQFLSRIFNLGKFRAIGRVPCGTPCYSTENPETFITVCVLIRFGHFAVLDPDSTGTKLKNPKSF